MLENIELFGNSLGTGTYPDGEGKSFLQNIFDVIHPVGETYIQYPAQKSPQEIYNKKDANNRIIIDSVWEEQLQYNSAFFRSEHLLGSYVYKANDETQYYLIDNLDNLTPINITGNNDVSIAGSPTSGQQKVIGDKTYQAYAVSGVNSSSNNYIEEGNSLSIQGNQSGYHRHTGTTDGGKASISINTAYGKVGLDDGKVDRDGFVTVDTDGSWAPDNGSLDDITYATGGTLYFNHSHGITQNNHSHGFTTAYTGGSSTDTESRPDNLTIKIWKRVS